MFAARPLCPRKRTSKCRAVCCARSLHLATGPKIATKAVRCTQRTGLFPCVAPSGTHASPAVLCFRCRWPGDPGSIDVPPGVALSGKGAKSQTRGRKLRSTGTKAEARGVTARRSESALVTKLKAHARDLEKKLGEALEQQTATADVLKVISGSVFELQPVLDTLVATAARLCNAEMAFIFRRQGEVYRLAANCGFPPAYEAFLKGVALSPGRATVTGRAALEGHAVHVVDILADPEYDIPETYGLGKSRTVLSVPLLREKVPIGMITVARQRVEPFTNKQVELVTTFADQAVIAIENVRLFDEVQAQKRELSDALKHQTATSEVLNVITRSPTDAQPVFDAIVQSAARLCEAMFSVVFLYDGDLLQLAATHNLTPEVLNKLFQTYPKRPDRSILSGRAVLDGKVAHVPDLLADREYSHQLALAGNWGSALAVPMLRDGKPAGAISVAKAEAVPFSERQIQLLTTFADQAVIAIGNVRLFDEVQARTQELSASLQQQTATADVLKIISRSTFDLKSVLQTLVESAARLCEADKATITRQIGGTFYRAEAYGFSAEFMDYVRALPVEPEGGTASGRALLEGRTVHIPDVLTDF